MANMSQRTAGPLTDGWRFINLDLMRYWNHNGGLALGPGDWVALYDTVGKPLTFFRIGLVSLATYAEADDPESLAPKHRVKYTASSLSGITWVYGNIVERARFSRSELEGDGIGIKLSVPDPYKFPPIPSAILLGIVPRRIHNAGGPAWRQLENIIYAATKQATPNAKPFQIAAPSSHP